METPAPVEEIVETSTARDFETSKEEPKKEEPKIEEPKKEEPKKKAHHCCRGLVITILILVLMTVGAYYFLRSQIAGWMEKMLQPQQTEEVVAATDTIVASAVDTIAEQAVDTVPMEPIFYEELITIEHIRNGSRLTWMAKKYYGDKMYWPYLYDANRDQITNPSDIEVGTPIRVPKLTQEQLDTTIERSRLRLEQLTREAQEACKR